MKAIPGVILLLFVIAGPALGQMGGPGSYQMNPQAYSSFPSDHA